jgi:parallel beta-helix repeat protein
MKRRFWGLLLVAMLLGLAQPVWGDDLYVVIAGGGVGTPISSVGQTISQPGFYYLKGNLSSAGSGNAITIAASEVTLDLMGFNLAGSGPGPSGGNGIYINSDLNNVEVRNGSVKGFSNGIYSPASNGKSHRLANLRVSGCNFGISDGSFGTIITGCQAANNTHTGIGIFGSDTIVDKNTAYLNTVYGFYIPSGGIVINNAARSNGTGFYLANVATQLVDRNASFANSTNWIGLSGCTKGLNTP